MHRVHCTYPLISILSMSILIEIILSLNLWYFKATSLPGWPSDLKPLEPATNTWRPTMVSCRAVKSLPFAFCKYKANTWTETREKCETLWHTNTQINLVWNISSIISTASLLSYFLCAPRHPFFHWGVQRASLPLSHSSKTKAFRATSSLASPSCK